MTIFVCSPLSHIGQILHLCNGASARKIFLITALSLLSWLSIFTGMLDLISANRGVLLGRDVAAVGIAVASIQLMMLYILDALFSRRLRRWLQPMFIMGYALLVLISVTFSFGFYWNLFESHHVSIAAAVTSVSVARQALEVGRSRLKELEQTFSSLSVTSTMKAEQERTRGGTCGPTVVGAGPLQLREADSQRLSYAREMVSQRTQGVETDIATIDSEFAKFMTGTSGARDAAVTGQVDATRQVKADLSQAEQHNAAMMDLDRRLGLTVSRYNSLRTDPQLFAIKDELARRSEQTTFLAPDRGRFVCNDIPLSAALKGAVRAIGELPGVSAQHLAAIEGEQATFEAFRRLQTSTRMVIRDTVNAATGVESNLSVIDPSEGLSGRDYLPLSISVFVDFCIFLIAMNRPWGQFHNLLGGNEADNKEELSTFLRVFYSAFVESHGGEPKTADLVRPLQDVVFSHNGHYFGVAPLSFHDQEHKESVQLSESRYVANVFVALEGRGLVKLVRPWRRWLSMLSERHIARKLKAQVSPFAEVNAFRLYRFAPQAWQGIVLRSVLNANDAPLTAPQGAEINNAPAPLQRRRSPEFEACHDTPSIGCEHTQTVLQGLTKPQTQLRLPAPRQSRRSPQQEQLIEDNLSADRQLVYDQSDSQEISYLEETEDLRVVKLQPHRREG